MIPSSLSLCQGETMAAMRQQLLFLYSRSPGLASTIVAWALYDGASPNDPRAGEESAPPYPSVLGAMRDGWRVIQVPPQGPPPESDRPPNYLANEFVLERLVSVV